MPTCSGCSRCWRRRSAPAPPESRRSSAWHAIGVSAKAGAVGLATVLIVGYQAHSDALELCFYSLAGGAILYVVGEVWTAIRRYGHRMLGLNLLALGFIAGVATDLIVTYGGG